VTSKTKSENTHKTEPPVRKNLFIVSIYKGAIDCSEHNRHSNQKQQKTHPTTKKTQIAPTTPTQQQTPILKAIPPLTSLQETNPLRKGLFAGGLPIAQN